MSTKLLIAALAVAFNISTAFAADDFAAIKATVQKHFKDVPVDSIKTTPIDGLYEVQSHYDLIYFYPKGEIFVLGQLISPDGKSITVASRDKIVEKTVAGLDLSKAIKTGSGKNIVIEFIDPDDSISRSTAEFWKTKSSVTRYSFLYVSTSENKEAAQIAEWILSQKDKAAALEEVLSGKHDQAVPEGATDEGRALFKENLRYAQNAHVESTPQSYINNKLFIRPDYEGFTRALGEGEPQAEGK